uniref:Uncharacterized protein n=1 Tax=Triticum urartu TaxID=4572 RepID=A0A8R7PAY7_TRIUA
DPCFVCAAGSRPGGHHVDVRIIATVCLDPLHVGAQEPDATVNDDSYYTRGAYYYVQPANDDQGFRRIRGRRHAPLSICILV